MRASAVSQGQRLAASPVVAAVEGFQEGLLVRGDKVDDLELQGLGGRGGDALADDAFGPFDVAAPLLGDAAGVGGGIVQNLFHHRAAFLLAAPAEADSHRMGGADIGTGRHGGEIGRQGDEGPGGGRPGAGRIDVGDDRYLRAQNRLDDGPHGGVQSPGGIEFDEDGPVVPGVGLFYARGDEIGDHRVDDPGNPKGGNDVRACGTLPPAGRSRAKKERQHQSCES